MIRGNKEYKKIDLGKFFFCFLSPFQKQIQTLLKRPFILYRTMRLASP